jgi:hypothetical protein
MSSALRAFNGCLFFLFSLSPGGPLSGLDQLRSRLPLSVSRLHLSSLSLSQLRLSCAPFATRPVTRWKWNELLALLALSSTPYPSVLVLLAAVVYVKSKLRAPSSCIPALLALAPMPWPPFRLTTVYFEWEGNRGGNPIRIELSDPNWLRQLYEPLVVI